MDDEEAQNDFVKSQAEDDNNVHPPEEQEDGRDEAVPSTNAEPTEESAPAPAQKAPSTIPIFVPPNAEREDSSAKLFPRI